MNLKGAITSILKQGAVVGKLKDSQLITTLNKLAQGYTGLSETFKSNAEGELKDVFRKIFNKPGDGALARRFAGSIYKEWLNDTGSQGKSADGLVKFLIHFVKAIDKTSPGGGETFGHLQKDANFDKGLQPGDLPLDNR